MITAASILASVLLVAAPANPVRLPKGFVELFEACEYQRAGENQPPQVHRYRLFVPRDRKATERYPLLVWLHGAGESGLDNWRNLKWLDLILDDLPHIEKYRFFILVVQCPKEESGWYFPRSVTRSESPGADDMLDVTYEILQKTLREQPVDPDRVYLSGVSSGGSACWEMAMRHPDVFAAVAPMASSGGDVSRAEELAGVPIWAFHNERDTGTPPDGDKKMIAAISGAGGNAILTLLPHANHECWQMAFRSYGLMAWMLDQRRGQWACWTPPGCRSWKWWHVFGVPAACVLLVVVGTYSERSRRQRRRTQAIAPAESETTHAP